MDKNPIMKKISAVAIIVLIVFFFLLNSRRTYVTETQILVLPKTEITAESYKQIMGNFESLLSSLPFYDSVEKNMGEDSTEDLSSYDRKNLWSSRIESKQVGKSGVISIKTFAKTALDSSDLNQVATKQFILSIGQYYNIRTDLELRIIEKPITISSVSREIPSIIATSLVLGIAAYLLVFLLLPLFLLKKNDISRQDLGKTILPSKDTLGKLSIFRTSKSSFTEDSYKFIDTKEEKKPEAKPEIKKEAAKITKEEKNKKETNAKKEEIKTEKKPEISEVKVARKVAASPDNLPVSENIPDFLFSSGPIAKEPEGKEGEEAKNEIDHKREASAEEVKARLNKLLRGE